MSVERALGRHARVHNRLVALAEQRLHRCDYSAALAYTQAAAEYAWRCPTGAFASPALERVVSSVRIAAFDSYPIRARGSVSVTGEPVQRVLHVLTRAEAIGGHTRLCWRWLRADADRQHSVALTGQGGWPVPAELASASANARGTLEVLDEHGGDLFDRTRALEGLAREADLIVLHTSPYDVVPLLALGDPYGRPATVFMNHSDHTFWLGLEASDVVAHFRPSGATLSRDRRGVTPERAAILPLPLLTRKGTVARAAARARLGIAAHASVLLTVASSQKYDVAGESSMVSILAPVLERVPDCILIAVGPRLEGVWARAARRHAGRVRAVGIQDDTAPYLAAADIYLDSFPMTSLTSMLEAGQYGLPLLRLDLSRTPGNSPLEPDDPAMQDALVTVTDAESYRALIVRWLSDAGERARVGETAKRSIENHHCGEHWRRRLDAVYAQATAMTPSPSSRLAEPAHLSTAYDLALVEMSSRSGVDVYFVRRLFDHCALVSPRRRLMMAVRFLVAMRDDLPSILAQRHRVWRRLRRVLRREQASDLSASS